MAVAARAYAPYSNFLVGAAVRARDGRVFEGVNVENAAYPLGVCAEKAALSAAVVAGAAGRATSRRSRSPRRRAAAAGSGWTSSARARHLPQRATARSWYTPAELCPTRSSCDEVGRGALPRVGSLRRAWDGEVALPKAAARTSPVEAVRSGFVAVAGRPNVGKSTLVNALCGRQGGDRLRQAADDAAARSSASRTATTTSSCSSTCPASSGRATRSPSACSAPSTRSFEDVDAVLLVLDCRERIGAGDRFIAERVFALGVPVVIALNKVDRLKPGHIATQMQTAAQLGDFLALHPVSAKTGDGIDELRGRARRAAARKARVLPARPAHRPPARGADRRARPREGARS